MRIKTLVSIAVAMILGQAALCETTIAAPPSQNAGKKQTQKAKPKSARDQALIKNHYVLEPVMKMNGYHLTEPKVIIVDKGSHFTHALQLQNRGVVRVLTISNAIGSQDKPTPPGRFVVSSKQKYPEWIPPKTIDPKQKRVKPYNKDRKNLLGVAAIFLNKYELALHGTNEPNMIRKSVSHGCIRHSNSDISQLYGMVRTGTPVYIVRKFRGTVLNKSDFGARKIAQAK